MTVALALEVMAKGFKKNSFYLFQRKKLKGVIAMGGGGGTFPWPFLECRACPWVYPKLCISTLATKDVSSLVGLKDIVLIPSVVDVAELNSIICCPSLTRLQQPLWPWGKVEVTPLKKVKGIICHQHVWQYHGMCQ